MVVQAIVPLIFVLIPVGCAMNFTFAKINIPGLGMIVNLTCCWIPVCNSLVTIFTVNAYKRIILSVFYKVLRITPSINGRRYIATVSAPIPSQRNLNLK
uniref:Uncharacterized protein n=1 Tax=Panagrolaimus davidi TaxID=227884 RepID=A0A914P6M5_9BILA